MGCLLRMDNVVLITSDPKELKRMLDITDAIAGRYHIEFGKEKNKVMKIGGGKTKPEFKRGAMNLEYRSNYKYQGYTLNDKNNMSYQTKGLKGKVEAAYQAILAISGNRNFKNNEMRTIWELIETSIVAFTTYGCEIWNPNIGEIKEITRIINNILKRVLMTPQSTPRKALYIETGLLDPETISQKQNDDGPQNGEQSKRKAKKLATAEGTQSWKETKNRQDKGHDRDNRTRPGSCKIHSKSEVKRWVGNLFKTKIDKKAQTKAKVKHLLEGLNT